MTHTVISSATKEVVIGFDRPFVMIGERINPTGRKLLAEEMKNGDFSRVEADALAQVAAGAHILDINAGVTAVNPNETEPPLMRQTLEIVQSLVDLPLCIDSSVTSALKVGLETAKGRPLVNSVTGEEERLEKVLPVVAEYGLFEVLPTTVVFGPVVVRVPEAVAAMQADHSADVVPLPWVARLGVQLDADGQFTDGERLDGVGHAGRHLRRRWRSGGLSRREVVLGRGVSGRLR